MKCISINLNSEDKKLLNFYSQQAVLTEDVFVRALREASVRYKVIPPVDLRGETLVEVFGEEQVYTLRIGAA